MIKKLSILFAVLISAAFCKDSWQCDSMGQMKCAMDNTCCRSRTSSFGWACFPLVQAVCCSDGVNVCPSGTICDLTAKTCRRTSLAFLEVPQTQAANATNPIVALKPVDALNFTYGFYQGVQIFSPVLTNSTCIQKSERLVADVVQLVHVFSNFTVENLATEIKEILNIFQDLVAIGESQLPVCKQLGLDLENLFERVYQHVANVKYVENLTSHTVFNLGKLKEILEAAVKDAQEQNYFRSGQGFGELVKFAALWDF